MQYASLAARHLVFPAAKQPHAIVVELVTKSICFEPSVFSSWQQATFGINDISVLGDPHDCTEPSERRHPPIFLTFPDRLFPNGAGFRNEVQWPTQQEQKRKGREKSPRDTLSMFLPKENDKWESQISRFWSQFSPHLNLSPLWKHWFVFSCGLFSFMGTSSFLSVLPVTSLLLVTFVVILSCEERASRRASRGASGTPACTVGPDTPDAICPIALAETHTHTHTLSLKKNWTIVSATGH